jgi:NADH-quinone oxidoreductase subunit I
MTSPQADSSAADFFTGQHRYTDEGESGMPMFEEAKGFGVTLRRLFRHDLTIEYPDERRPLEERFRGLPALRTDPATQEAICVGCSMCETICPTQCISIGFTPDADTGERNVVTFTLDAGRCMWCGLCARWTRSR